MQQRNKVCQALDTPEINSLLVSGVVTSSFVNLLFKFHASKYQMLLPLLADYYASIHV